MSADYERLAHDKPRRVTDHTARWNQLAPIETAADGARAAVEQFCKCKRITFAALQRMGARVEHRGDAGYCLAYAGSNGNGTITAIKYRPLNGTSHHSKGEPGSVWLWPIVVGDPGSLDWLIAEGETDAARLHGLVGDRCTIVALPTGARAEFKSEWAAKIPRGARIGLCHDADADGDAGAVKAAGVIGAGTFRVRPPIEGTDWCDWDGDAAGFLQLAATAKASRNGTGREVTFTPASAIQMERVRWLWRGRVAVGAVAMLAGQQGLGKSTMTVELAARVTRGTLDGDLHDHPSAVLIVTLEDHVASVVKPRLAAADADLDLVQIVGVKVAGQDGLITLPDDLEAIEAGVRAHDARLLIVDPVIAALSGGIDAYRDHDVRRAFAPLARLAERCDLAVVAVMHLTKAQSGDLLARVSGSVAFTAAPRSVLAFVRDPDDPAGDAGDDRVIVHVKSNWGRLASSLSARIDEHKFDDDPPLEASRLVMLGESDLTASDFVGQAQDHGGRADRAAAADLIAEELADGEAHPASTIEAAAKARDITRATLFRAAQNLEAEGSLERERIGFPARSMWRWAQLSQPRETTGGSNGCDNWATPITTGVYTPSPSELSQARERETTGMPGGAREASPAPARARGSSRGGVRRDRDHLEHDWRP